MGGRNGVSSWRVAINKTFLMTLLVAPAWAQEHGESRAGLPSRPTPGRIAPAGNRSNQYFGRGLDLDRGTDFAFSMDGIPLNLPSSVRGPGFTDTEILIPETVNAPVYRKGPYQAEQGAFATVGSTDLEPEDQLEKFAKVTYGGAEGDRFGRFLWAHSPSRLSYALEGTRTYRPWNDWEGSAKLSGFLRYAPGPQGLGWSGTVLATQERADGGSASPQRDLPDHFEEDWGDLRVGDGKRLQRVYAGATHRADRGGGVTDLFRCYAGFAAQTTWVNNTYYLEDPYWGDQREMVERRAFLGLGVQRQWLVRSGGLEWNHQLGFQGRLDRLMEAEVHASYDRDRIRPLMQAQGDLRHAALFGQTTLHWGEGWSAFAGLRVDHQRNDIHGASPWARQDTSATLVSPRLGLTWSPLPDTALRAAWGQGFRLGDALRDTRPMIRAHSMEVGAQTRPLSPWETSVTLWRLDLEAEAVFTPAANASLNGGPARHQGLEWYNGLKLGPWKAEACLAWSRARFTGAAPGQDSVAGSIPQTGFLGLGWKERGTGLELKYRRLGAYALTPDRRFTGASQNYLEVRLEQEWGPWAVAVEVLNALNKREYDQEYYYVSRLPGENALGVADRHLKTSDTQAIRLEVRRRF